MPAYRYVAPNVNELHFQHIHTYVLSSTHGGQNPQMGNITENILRYCGNRRLRNLTSAKSPELLS